MLRFRLLSGRSRPRLPPTQFSSIPAPSRQEILGFGAAITEASAYMLSRLSDAERAPVMHDLFAPDAMALNVCRTCIGSSDYATKVYSYDESTEPDPDLKKFSIDHDKEFYLPMLREARKAESRNVSVLVAVEPSGMDEAEQLHARRRNAQAKLRSVCALLRQVSRGVQGRRRRHQCGDRSERNRRRAGRPHARMPVGAGAGDGVRRAIPRTCNPQGRLQHEDLDSRSQLQPVGPRDRRAQRSSRATRRSTESPGTATLASQPR